MFDSTDVLFVELPPALNRKVRWEGFLKDVEERTPLPVRDGRHRAARTKLYACPGGISAPIGVDPSLHLLAVIPEKPSGVRAAARRPEFRTIALQVHYDARVLLIHL